MVEEDMNISVLSVMKGHKLLTKHWGTKEDKENS